MSTQIKVPDERAVQLRRFAEARGIGVVEAIGALLKEAGAADEVPGFEIMPVLLAPRKLFSFAMEGGFLAHLFTAAVLELAGMLERSAKLSQQGELGFKTPASKLEGERQIGVWRHSRHSIVIVGIHSDEDKRFERRLTLDLALDLAAQLRAAVAD